MLSTVLLPNCPLSFLNLTVFVSLGRRDGGGRDGGRVARVHHIHKMSVSL